MLMAIDSLLVSVILAQRSSLQCWTPLVVVWRSKVSFPLYS